MHRRSFFSREKESNKGFFWIVLPLIIVEDVEFIFGIAYVILSYVFAFLTRDFSFLLVNIALITFLCAIQFMEDQQFRKLPYLLLAPVSWFLFHVVTFVEANAFIKAYYTHFLRREVKWQKWQRTGVADS